MRRSRAVAGGIGAVVLIAGAVTAVAMNSGGTHTAGAPGPALVGNGTPLADGASETSPLDLTVTGAVGVRWTVDGTFLAADTTAPFELVTNLTAGRHRVSAEVTDSAGSVRKLAAAFTISSTGAAGASPPSNGPLPSASAIITAAPTPTSANGGDVQVATSSALVDALAAAVPGTTIHLRDGVYRAPRQLTISNACTAARPCVLTGGRGAILDGGGSHGHYGLYLLNAPYWTVEGVRVTNASKGIVADGSSHLTINGVEVSYIGDEGVHLRDLTSDSVVENSSVHDTGLTSPQFGEGIYIGSAQSNWTTYSRGLPDASDRDQIIGNSIARTASENVDIKEGTVGGLISGNTFDATAISGANNADSWVDIKGNGWTVQHNTGANPTNNPDFRDGYQTHILVSGDGEGNVFRSNISNLGKANGYGFRLQTPKKTHNVVGCENTVTGGIGLANEDCSNS